MIIPYVITSLVFGMVLSYLWVIHHAWLRHVFKDDPQPAVCTRIVILGGGFGGLYSALHFDKTIASDPTVEVTLASPENLLVFTPMLHEVAAGDLDLSNIVSPLRQMLKNGRFLHAEVDSIVIAPRRAASNGVSALLSPP